MSDTPTLNHNTINSRAAELAPKLAAMFSEVMLPFGVTCVMEPYTPTPAEAEHHRHSWVHDQKWVMYLVQVDTGDFKRHTYLDDQYFEEMYNHGELRFRHTKRQVRDLAAAAKVFADISLQHAEQQAHFARLMGVERKENPKRWPAQADILNTLEGCARIAAKSEGEDVELLTQQAGAILRRFGRKL